MARFRSRFLVVLTSLVFSLVLCEVVLQLARLGSRRVDYLLLREPPKFLADERLLHRPHPLYPEHDAWGFRNQTVPEEVCLVALGDSQTYGHKVRREEAWPQQLAQRTGLTTYNLAFGGYGPVHSLLLWPQAMELDPKVVIAAFYFGNDLYDAYNLVYNRDSVAELRSHDQDVKAALGTVPAKISFEPLIAPRPSPPRHGRLREWAAERSALYGLARAVKHSYYQRTRVTKENPYFLDDWQKVLELTAKSDEFQPFEQGGIRTVFTPGRRLSALDLSDPRISEGLRISLEALRRMAERARTRGVTFVVLLIPTKELAFHEQAAHVSAGRYGELLAAETRARRRMELFLEAEGILFIDATVALRSALERGEQPYPISANGHKNATGHEVVADLVAAWLQKQAQGAVQRCH